MELHRPSEPARLATPHPRSLSVWRLGCFSLKPLQQKLSKQLSHVDFLKGQSHFEATCLNNTKSPKTHTKEMSPCVCRFTFKMTRARQDAEGPQSCWEGGDLSWLPPLHPPATGVREMAALASVLATGWIRWGPGRGGANEKASPSPAASSRHCRCQARKGVWPGPCVPRGREGWCPASHRLRPHG